MDKGSSSTVTYMRWRNSDHNNVGNQAADKDEYFQASIEDKCSVNIDNVASAGTFTLDEGLDALGFGSFQWKLLFVTGFSWVADAMEMMILSILGPQLHCDWRLSGYKVALITSVVFAGMGLSSSLWGNLSDKYGRKKGLTICMSWTFFYGMLSALAPNFGWLLALRGLVGVGIGGAHQSVTLYSEFIPSKARGFSIILMAAFWALGVVCEVLLALFIMPTLGWRWLLGLSSVPLGIFLCLCVWLHESPRFDLMSGNQAKVMGTLESIAKHNNKALPRGRIVCNVQNNRGRLQDLFTKEYCKTTLLLWFIWFSFAFNYYGIILLTTEMFQARDTCGGLVVVLGTVDYLGRKKSMALPFFIFSISLLPLYACIGRVSLTVFIFIARAFISGGFQVVFVYTPEVFPTETRAFAVGTCSAMSRVGALLTPFVAQVLLRQSAHLTLSAYCVCSFLASCACLLLPIETSGRSLRESEPKNS